MPSADPATPRDGRWDHLIERLHELRNQAGAPSYAELAQRVAEQRIADGMDAHRARIAKSSVHDAFRFGRTRINVTLTEELVRAMGAEPSAVALWVRESLVVHASRTAGGPAEEPPSTASDRRQVVLLLLGCLALNLGGRVFVDYFHLPIYLDMVGTAVAAIALGPWRGAGVGVATNLIGVIGSGWVSIPFGLVNVAGALVWGYGVRRWHLGRSLPRFFGLNILAALVCSLLAVPIIVTVYGHDLRAGHDVITNLVEDSVHTFLIAVSFSNVLTSLADKLISGFVALVAVSALPLALRTRAELLVVVPPPHPAETPSPGPS